MGIDMNLRKIRTLVVDDSILFREFMVKSLSADSAIEVVGTAADPVEALKLIKELEPQVVTMDVEMPKMNGIDFIKKIMPEHPIPVVVVTSLPMNALDALDAGAVDFVSKPRVKSSSDLFNFSHELVIKVKIASMAKLKKVTKPVRAERVVYGSLKTADNLVIAIGASTGGTDATVTVIEDLPVTTPGIVVVQHMPEKFTRMYAERLDRICKMEVKEAEDGDRVQTGRILIAPGDYQMRMVKDSRGYVVRCARGEKVSGHCPSVDVLFESVAKAAGKNAVGIILTGMGADGAKGLMTMRDAGAYTIGQNKETCVVYGMPMVAFNIGAVMKQAPIQNIGSLICAHINKQ
ncbi:MAG: chemotaxis response regulator protein-glutamate methylesterase [Acetanaerobacterium sp.]